MTKLAWFISNVVAVGLIIVSLGRLYPYFAR